MRKIATRRWERKNPEKYQAQVDRRRIRVLGLTVDASKILHLLKTQTKCALCGRTFDEMKHRRHIDHDHITGKFRGLIGQSCNFGLGHFNDSPEMLRAAARYLTKH